MFGIGLPEFILILVVIVLVVGPEQMPDVVRKGVAFLREARRHIFEIKEAVDQQTEPLRQPLQDIRDDVIHGDGAATGEDAGHGQEKAP